MGRGWWSGKWWQIWVFWVIMILHALATLIFTRGFLLTRTELPYYSHCSDFSQSPCLFNTFRSCSESDSVSVSDANLNQTHQHCWLKPVVGRLVIIILDALRFDFVAPSMIFEEPKPWMDRLQVLQELASQRASSARIFRAIADPPTTSLQRLKGLTTGGLPTFIDIGNSFGAPAIVEDNLIHQLVQNGKRVLMMGDDTWMQLFPHHFKRSYPYPSFNVKDLHTVDNGCIDHLLPSLYQEDWDVLIAHFLGVDHAGHIFGVDSIQMIEKLEQYNVVLQKVIEVLESQSGPDGLHENTFLLVMGDHGQTINGDHGGGTSEEVETSIFAMSFKKPATTQESDLGTSFCELNLDGNNVSISSIQQLDFAATISALLGIPFPFGSIGHVDPELYALGSGMGNFKSNMENCQNQSKLHEWIQSYTNVLCINSWQVKRYLDVYSASSVMGFSSEDLLHITDLYAQAVEKWSRTTKNLLLNKIESSNSALPALKKQIDVYSNFLANVAELARSKWTEFNLMMMSIGLSIMFVSVLIHILAIKRVKKQYDISFSSGEFKTSFGLLFSCFIVVIRACSFLSNSYILEEGKVASFLLATSGVAKLHYSPMKKNILLEVVVFLLLITICRFTIELGLSKQGLGSEVLNVHPSWMLRIAPVWMFVTELVPIIALVFLAFLQYKVFYGGHSARIEKCVVVGTNLSYVLLALHWASESNVLNLSWVLEGVGRNCIPQIIYAIGFGQLLLLMCGHVVSKEKSLDCKKSLVTKTVAMLSAWSSTVILLGKQGSLVSVAAIIGGYCIIRSDIIRHNAKNESRGNLILDPLPVTQWSLLAVCLFFCTGHWCAFDGLRYGAAFIGFDEFVLVRQAILLTIDTFGFSLILPVFGLPFIVAFKHLLIQTEKAKHLVFARLSLVYMIYGLIMATTVTATLICVTIQRRHLMVWGLFAPKFVFDVVGLIVMDVLICLASLYYLVQVDSDTLQERQSIRKF